MLTGGTSALYRQVLAAGGAAWTVRVEVWQRPAGTWIRVDPFGDAGLPITSGSLSATLANGVTRTVSLTVPMSQQLYRNGTSMIPLAGGDLLDPLASELRIRAGWKAGAAVVGWWPVFTGPIVDVSAQTGTGDLNVSASDRAEGVVASKFVSPRSAPTDTPLVTTLIRDLIDDVWGPGSFGDHDETYTTVPKMTWDVERSSALGSMASAATCFWYAVADGTFTVRRIPWAAASYGTPLVTFADGAGMLDASVRLSRSGVCNIAVVPSSNTSGSDPFYGTSWDLDPGSRTRVDGPLGRRVLRADGENVTSSGQADTIAKAKRLRSLASLEEWSMRIVSDPSLELGDVCRIMTMGVQRDVALASFTLPLSGAPEMSTSWRRAGGEVS